jgi:hypothetical protein
LWLGIRDRGPRWGVEVEVVSLRRLAVGPEEISDDGASGASDLLLLQIPIEPSVDAERMRDEGPWTASASTLPLCPYSSRVGFKSAEK